MSNTRLEALLKAKLGVTQDTNIAPLFIGGYALTHNTDLALLLLEEYAELVEDFPSYSEYKTIFKPLVFTEKAPKIEDGKFNKYDPYLTPKERQIKKAFLYTKAKKQYNERHRDHETKGERFRRITSAFDNSVRGYLSFACSDSITSSWAGYPQNLAKAERFFFTSNQKFYIDEKQREKHSYITASSGHGKSVTLEKLFNHYLTDNTNTAVILLDPHGDLALDCARLLPNKDSKRLVYIKPSLNRKITPCLNPFYLESKEWDNINKASDSLIEVFSEVMKSDGEGAKFTPQMVTILKPCLSALLHMGNASFVDLMKFLDEDPSKHAVYLNYAKRHLSNPTHLDTLGGDFLKDTFNPSKLSIKTKIRNLLNDDYFYHFLVGKSTFDLRAEIERKAVIVFDLSDLTEKSKDAIGRFLMATITNIATQRAKVHPSKRIPIHLFVDECQNFVSKSMKTTLTEARKFGLHGTFAQQFTGQGMDNEMKKAIIGNSAIKMTGNNGVNDLKVMSAEIGISVEELQTLRQGEFFIQSGKGKPAVKVKIPMIQQKEKMTFEQWQIVKIEQVQKYYRPIKAEPDHKPQHTTRNPSQKIEITPEIVRTTAPLKPKRNKKGIDELSGVKPHLKPRGKDLKNPFD